MVVIGPNHMWMWFVFLLDRHIGYPFAVFLKIGEYVLPRGVFLLSRVLAFLYRQDTGKRLKPSWWSAELS